MQKDIYSLDTDDTIRHCQKMVCDFINKNVEYKNVLDVGSGNCGMREWLKNYNGIDPYFKHEHSMQKSIYDIEQVYDLVIYNHVLEHIKNPYNEIEEAFKKCRKIFVAVPSVNAKNKYWLDGVDDHLHVFTPNTLKRLLVNCGFSVVFLQQKEIQKDRLEIWAVAEK